MQLLEKAISEAVAEESSCVPPGAILLTMTLPDFERQQWHPIYEKSIVSVRQLQFRRVANEHCLMRRVVSIRYRAAQQAGDTDDIGRSVNVPLWQSSRNWLCYGTARDKWSLIARAAEVARSVLWVDPTVLLLRNPFEPLARFAPAQSADVLYMSEAPCWRAAGTLPPDGGASEGRCAKGRVHEKIVYSRNATVAAALAKAKAVGLRAELLAAAATKRVAAAATRAADVSASALARTPPSNGASPSAASASAAPERWRSVASSGSNATSLDSLPPVTKRRPGARLSPSPGWEASEESQPTLLRPSAFGLLLDEPTSSASTAAIAAVSAPPPPHFVRVHARALPLAFVQHGYDAYRAGIVSTCRAALYVVDHLALNPPKKGPWARAFANYSRNSWYSLSVAASMEALLAEQAGGCSEPLWTLLERAGGGEGAAAAAAAASGAAAAGAGAAGAGPAGRHTAATVDASDAMATVGVTRLDDIERDDVDGARRVVLAALRAAPVVKDSLLAGLAALEHGHGVAADERSRRFGVRPGGGARPVGTDDGLWLEFGSWKGVSTKKMIAASCCLGRSARMHAFDSFRGLPERWRGGWFGERGAFDLRGRPPFYDERVRWHVGWFNETLPRFLVTHPRNVSFVHVDCDLYSSASLVLSSLAARLVPGAILVFDELINYAEFAQHEMRAFIELLQGRYGGGRRSFRALATSAFHIMDDPDKIRKAISCGKACLSGKRALRQTAVIELV